MCCVVAIARLQDHGGVKLPSKLKHLELGWQHLQAPIFGIKLVREMPTPSLSQWPLAHVSHAAQAEDRTTTTTHLERSFPAPDE